MTHIRIRVRYPIPFLEATFLRDSIWFCSKRREMSFLALRRSLILAAKELESLTLTASNWSHREAIEWVSQNSASSFSDLNFGISSSDFKGIILERCFIYFLLKSLFSQSSI